MCTVSVEMGDECIFSLKTKGQNLEIGHCSLVVAHVLSKLIRLSPNGATLQICLGKGFSAITADPSLASTTMALRSLAFCSTGWSSLAFSACYQRTLFSAMTSRVPDNEASSGFAPRRSSRVRKPSLAAKLADPDDSVPSRKTAKRAGESAAGTQKPAKRKKNSRKREPKQPSDAEIDGPKKGVNAEDPERSESSPDAPPASEATTKPDSQISEPTALPERPWGELKDLTKLKIVTWNVASCRSVVKNGSLLPYITKEAPDVLCIQETKMTEKALEEFPEVNGYDVHWNHSKKKGYSGVAIFIREDLTERKKVVVNRVEPGMGLPEADDEGRVLTCYLGNGLALVNAYVPNSGGKLARLGFRTSTFEPAMREFLNDLAKKHRVVYCGDLNVAHMEIDIHNSKGNQKSAGHTPEERQEFSNFLASGAGWIDSFRELNPGLPGYTYYSRRFGPRLKKEGKGWRLDYHVLDSASFKSGMVGDIYIRTDVEGSDHYPLVLEYRV